MCADIRPPVSVSSRTSQFDRYGQTWNPGTTDLAIELACYALKLGPDTGALGVEQHFRNAFRIAWPKFQWHDWMEMLMTAWCNERFLTVIGHTRATKTYGIAHLAYLDYCSSPFETWTSLTTVTFDGLKSRMWADMMAAVETASFKCPFKITSSSNEMKMRVSEKGNRKDEKFMIEGFATSKTRDSAGRIQGKHANRRRLVLDEAQELPDAIFTAEVNAGSAPDFKSARLANPVDKQTVFGRDCCEPAGGWQSIHDSDLYWRTKAGHLVLHFDGLQNFNQKLWIRFDRGEISKSEYEAKRLPFMLAHEYIEEVRTQKGEDSLEWWMYIRGFFPGDGIVSRVCPDILIDRASADLDFDYPPTPFSVLDPAYEFDNCVQHFGVHGKMRSGNIGVQYRESEVIDIGVTDKIRTKDEQIADKVKANCVARGVAPENFIMDKTGNGRSVWSHLSKDWGRGVQGVEFGGKPTDRHLMEGDALTCEDQFCYFVDELHFRAAEWMKSGRMGGLKRLAPETAADLAARRYTVQAKKQRIESKKELKKRLGRSPDYGDAYVLGAELMARKGYYPGRATDEQKEKQRRWASERRAAVRACRRYAEAQQFAGS